MKNKIKLQNEINKRRMYYFICAFAWSFGIVVTVKSDHQFIVQTLGWLFIFAFALIAFFGWSVLFSKAAQDAEDLEARIDSIEQSLNQRQEAESKDRTLLNG